jgi:hypothetical protein
VFTSYFDNIGKNAASFVLSRHDIKKNLTFSSVQRQATMRINIFLAVPGPGP